MRQILSNLIRNQNFQDIASLGRGVYRVCEGLQNKEPLQRQGSGELASQPDMQPPQQPTPEKIETLSTRSNPDVEVKSSSLSFELPPSAQPEIKSFTENKVPDTSFSRALQFGLIGMRLAGSTMAGVLTGQGLRQSAVSESNAELLAKGLCKMRGAPLKLAQALSIQEDKLIPEHIRKAFEKARQSADIMPKSQLQAMMAQELGTDWAKRFDHFEETPFAAASIGQVHRGVIGGLEVAVKVQYPGVRESIDSDMSNLRRLMTYTNIFPKTMFLDKLLEHTKKELYEECDYLVEAAKQERYRQLLINHQQEYVIPKIFSEFTTTRILTSEYKMGEDLDFVAQHYPQHVRNEIGRRIMELTLRELFQWRFMQSDPNPSNFFYLRSTDQLILLDFGAAHEYSSEFIDLYIEIIHAAAHLNREVCLRKSEAIGFLTGKESLRMQDAHVDSILTVGEPFHHEGEFDFGAQTITDKIYQLMPVMLRESLFTPSETIRYTLFVQSIGAYLMNMKLKSRVNCRNIFMKLYDAYKRN